jgi:hypothetical protein
MKLFKASSLVIITSVVPMLSLIISISPSRAGLPDLSTAGRDACKDIAIGNDATSRRILASNSSDERHVNDMKDTHNNQDTLSSTSSSESKTSENRKDIESSNSKRSESRSGNVGFGPIKAGGSTQESTENTQNRDGSQTTDENDKTNNTQNSDIKRRGDNSQRTESTEQGSSNNVLEETTSTVRQGKDCDGMGSNITKVQVNRQDNETSLQIVEKKLEAERDKNRLDMLRNVIGK